MRKQDIEVGCNADKPVREVKHSALERASTESLYRSHCPVCEEGVLLVRRDSKTAKLLAEDNCIRCGQRYKYLDIETLRQGER